MVAITKIADGRYEADIGSGSIEKAVSANSVDVTEFHMSSNQTFVAEIKIIVSKEFCDRARALSSSRISLDSYDGSDSSGVTIIRGIMSSQIPLAEAAGPDGKIPVLSPEEVNDIGEDLHNVQRDFEVTITGEIKNGTQYVLRFMPDARGFDIKLVPLGDPYPLFELHPYVVTDPFVIDTLGPEYLSGSNGQILLASLDDAKVFVKNRPAPCKLYDGLPNEVQSMADTDLAMQMTDIYIEIANMIFWRNPLFESVEIPGEPFMSITYGVGLTGKALVYADLSQLTATSTAGGASQTNALIGIADTFFVYGDIRYPADPVLSAFKPKFDIITDSEEWTKYGPISERYVGSELNAIEATTIFSWEGRSSATPRAIPEAIARLEDY